MCEGTYRALPKKGRLRDSNLPHKAQCVVCKRSECERDSDHKQSACCKHQNGNSFTAQDCCGHNWPPSMVTGNSPRVVLFRAGGGARPPELSTDTANFVAMWPGPMTSCEPGPKVPADQSRRGRCWRTLRAGMRSLFVGAIRDADRGQLAGVA